MVYDYLIVGSGFFGSICAHELKKHGHKVLVIEKRNHIGGNCYTKNIEDINVHTYGPHIFHTNNKHIWDWINQFAEFNNFRYTPVANYEGELYSLPFSMWTFNKLWGVKTPTEAKSKISKQTFTGKPTNLEEQALSLVGEDVYEKLIKGYTKKQWMKDPKQLPASIIKRLPVRFTWDNNYFNDRYQGIPIGGYTQIFEKLLDGIEVKLDTDYFVDELPKHNKVIYTGPIDKFFDYRYGDLEYKSVEWTSITKDVTDWQGIAVMNYTSEDIPYTRLIEHKHFDNQNQDKTYLSWEYPKEYKRGVEPFYPVNDSHNNNIYNKYKKLANELKDVYFGGRLAEYKYYDMHQIIASALTFVKKLNNEN